MLLRERRTLIESITAMRDGIFCAIIANCKMKDGFFWDGQGWIVWQLAITVSARCRCDKYAETLIREQIKI